MAHHRKPFIPAQVRAGGEHDEGVFHACEKFFRAGYAANRGAVHNQISFDLGQTSLDVKAQTEESIRECVLGTARPGIVQFFIPIENAQQSPSVKGISA